MLVEHPFKETIRRSEQPPPNAVRVLQTTKPDKSPKQSQAELGQADNQCLLNEDDAKMSSEAHIPVQKHRKSKADVGFTE